MRTAIGLLALALLRLALDVGHLLGRPARYWNWEEAYNFTVAWYVWWAGLWDQALNLQAKAFCGGCSVVSALALPGIWLGGDELLAWKSVPLAWGVATLFAGFYALDRLVGRPAAWGWAALWAVPPMGVSELGLMAWGNHAESTLFVLLALGAYAAKRPLALGLALGLGLWFGRTSGYAWVLLPLWAWRSRVGLPWIAAGLATAALTFVPAARGDVGTYQMTLQSLLPGPDFVARITTLVGPEGLGARAWPDGHTSGAWLLVGAALGIAARPTVSVLGATVLFGLLFGGSDFVVPRVGNAAPLLNFRYHAPWLHLLLLLTAAGLGGVGWRRWLGALGVVCVLVPSALGQARTLAADPPTWVGSTPVIDHAHFAAVAIGRIDATRLAAAHSEDARTEATLRRMEGYLAARRVRGGATLEEERAKLAGAGLEGLGQGLGVEARTLAAWNARLGPEMGRGVGWNLGLALFERRERGPVDLGVYRQGLADGDACGACVAGGFALIATCRGATACLDALLTEEPEVVYGAGVACRAPGRPRAACEGLADRYGPTFAAGLDDAMAGTEVVFR